MDIVKAFNSNSLHTEIVIKGTHEDPLFRASDVGTVLDITNIRTTIIDFNETEKVVQSMHTIGGLQNVTFLTEKGLYKVLFKSRKPIAEKFQNWVCEVIKELRLKGTYDLQQQLEQAKEEILYVEDKKKKEYELKLIEETALEKQSLILREFGTIGSLVYICKVKSFNNGKYVIKIGESRAGALARYNEHKSKYDECLLLDCFIVNKCRDFEIFLQNHENIKHSRVTDLPGHEHERELFLIGDKLTYLNVLNVIKKNIKKYNDYNHEIEKLQLELEILKIKSSSEPTLCNNSLTHTLIENNVLQELINIANQLSCKIENLEKSNKAVLDKLNSSQTKVVTGFSDPLPTLGPRLQCINPETMQLVKVYESVSECMNENNEIKRPSINKAIVENTIYHGFRWLLVDRNLDPNIITNLEPTKKTRAQNLGYIAKLDKDKTEILNVYLDRKNAAAENEYLSYSALDAPVKNFTLTNGHYYALYDTCEEDLREEFVIKNNNREPILYKNGIGQFDAQNNLIQEFICKYDCIRSLRISDKTLEKALTKCVMYNNHYFKCIDSKVKCF